MELISIVLLLTSSVYALFAVAGSLRRREIQSQNASDIIRRVRWKKNS